MLSKRYFTFNDIIWVVILLGLIMGAFMLENTIWLRKPYSILVHAVIYRYRVTLDLVWLQTVSTSKIMKKQIFGPMKKPYINKFS